MNHDQLEERLKSYQRKCWKSLFEVAAAEAVPFNWFTTPAPVRQEAHNPGPGGSIPSPAPLRIIVSTPKGAENPWYKLVKRSKEMTTSVISTEYPGDLAIVATDGHNTQLQALASGKSSTLFLNHEQVDQLVEALKPTPKAEPDARIEILETALKILAARIVGLRDYSDYDPDLENSFHIQRGAQQAFIDTAIGSAKRYHLRKLTLEAANEQISGVGATVQHSADNNSTGACSAPQPPIESHYPPRGRR